jgi:ketosteroid isomerase-like protein
VSSANPELVRTLYAAWERGDFSATEWADPEIEYVIADGPAPGRWTGLAGMAEAYRAVLEVWEGFAARRRSTASSMTSVSWCSYASARAARRAGWRSGRQEQEPRT